MSSDYENDFDDFDDPSPKAAPKASYAADSYSKPLGSNNKPDWLKNNDSKPFGSKPAIGGANKISNNYSNTKPLEKNEYTSQKAEKISGNRMNSRRNPSQNPPASKPINNDYSLKSNRNANKPTKKKRDFSVNLPPKPKKINLPKDYLDKYTKNNPVRDLEKSIKSIKENIK